MPRSRSQGDRQQGGDHREEHLAKGSEGYSNKIFSKKEACFGVSVESRNTFFVLATAQCEPTLDAEYIRHKKNCKCL